MAAGAYTVGAAQRRPYKNPSDRNDTSIAVPQRPGGMVLMNPLNEPGGARGARRRNSGSETMPPKNSVPRSPSVNISKGNRGTFFFAACLANPELRLKHLRAPRDRPRRARHAAGVLSFMIPFQRADGRSRSTVASPVASRSF